MKVYILAENTACREDLQEEHGLSLYIETKTNRILFDAGQSDAFYENAVKMGIDLSLADICILSHGHYDHGGGLFKFLSVNRHAPVYISPHAFGAHYRGEEKYIGLDPALKACERFIWTKDEQEIAPGMTLYSCNHVSLQEPINSWGLTIQNNDCFEPDPFLHEQYLMIEEAGEKILISGCSHKGIINLVSYFQPDIVIGGFHLKSTMDEALLSQTARKLLALPARYYTGHCTGEEQYRILHEIMGERLDTISTGKILEI